MSNLFDNYNRDSVFRDRFSLTPEFVPEELPCRDDETQRLVEGLSILLDPFRPVSVNIAIIGNAGIGKTTLAKHVTKHLESYSVANKISLETHYINCHSFRTKTSILRRLATDRFHIQGRGFSDEELMEMLANKLKRENKRIVLIIDEADMLRGEDILAFIHMNELFEPGVGRLSLIIISRRRAWTLMLDAHLSGRVQDQLNLQPYTRDQLEQILEYRRKLGFFANVVPPEVFEMIVDIAAATGNARHGIEIMLRCGMMANSKGASQINPEFVRAAKNEVYPELRPEVFTDLKPNELIVALAIARILSSGTGIAYTTINEAYAKYLETCSEFSISKQAKASFRLYLETLTRLGIVSAQVRALGEGKRGRRSYITLHDIPALIIKERVEHALKSKLKEK